MNKIRRKYKSNEVVVNNKSNFKSHLVKCQNIMDDISFDQLVLKAMGKAIDRSWNIANQLNENNFNTFDITRKDYMIELVEDKRKKTIEKFEYDQFDPDDDKEVEKKTTRVPATEITIRKSKLELEKIKQLKKLPILNPNGK